MPALEVSKSQAQAAPLSVEQHHPCLGFGQPPPRSSSKHVLPQAVPAISNGKGWFQIFLVEASPPTSGPRAPGHVSARARAFSKPPSSDRRPHVFIEQALGSSHNREGQHVCATGHGHILPPCTVAASLRSLFQLNQSRQGSDSNSPFGALKNSSTQQNRRGACALRLVTPSRANP